MCVCVSERDRVLVCVRECVFAKHFSFFSQFLLLNACRRTRVTHKNGGGGGGSTKLRETKKVNRNKKVI